MTDAITLRLPMPPSVTNPGARVSRHWRSTERRKKAYWELCDLHLALGLLPDPPATPFQRAHISSVMHLGGQMDTDNAMGRHKYAVDWLKRAGYIADDRRKNLHWTAFPEQVVKRTGEYWLVLTLTPING